MHVLAPAPFGGLEQVVTTLATEQRASGKSVQVVQLVENGADESTVSMRLKVAGVDVHTVSLPPRAYASQLSALRRLAKAVAPDVIHTHGYVPDVLGAALRSLNRGPRLVSTVHGFTGGDWKNRVYERLQQLAFRRFDAVVGVSRRLSDKLKEAGISAARIHTIPNAWRPLNLLADAIEARHTLGIPSDVFSIGWVGRVSHEKALDVLVNALPHVVDIPFHLTVVGDGPMRESVSQSAARLDVAAQISWVGVVENAARLMRAFDVLVISSRSEGTPMNLLEAMSAGVPLLATNVGGIPDVVSDDQALLVPSNDPQALATGLRMIQRDREGAMRRAANARERVESAFGVKDWVESYDRVYSSV
jgi:glycosyltransferase involved in cell wall biosynthesis